MHKCPIANCTKKVKRLRSIAKNQEAPVSSGSVCRNEYYIHDHDTGELWKFKDPEVNKERFKK